MFGTIFFLIMALSLYVIGKYVFKPKDDPDLSKKQEEFAKLKSEYSLTYTQRERYEELKKELRSITSEEKSGLFLLGAILMAALSFILFVSSFITIVDAGTVKVVKLFGVVKDEPLTEGFNFINPFADTYEMSIKTIEVKETMYVPSKEGLTVTLETSLLYRLTPEKAPEVFKTVGQNYNEVIIAPQFRSVVRGITSKFEAKSLYTEARDNVSFDIQKAIQSQVAHRGIVIEAIPLRSVTLPPGLAQSIENKLRIEQESQQMEFVLKKEEQEAERKRIEARGISDFQRIVSQGISEQLLKWKGIEATQELAKSQNAKVVVIGSGSNGLPLILGN